MTTLTDFSLDYAEFLIKTITIVVAVALIMTIKQASKQNPVEFELINKKRIKETMANISEFLSGSTAKNKKKELKSGLKKIAKLNDNLFVINFKGDIEATEVESLREVVTSIIEIANPSDRVLIKLESPGGQVSAYGLVASQIARFRNKNIHVTVAIDQVAASGGYLIAAVADNIIAAPFAIIGSIGVILQAPNINKLLKKHEVEVVELTAGKYKRPLTVLGENTKEGKEKAKEQLESIHENFKSHVASHRPEVAIDEVATGEIWLAKEALSLKLVDKIQTSDDFILNALATHKVVNVRKTIKKCKIKSLKNFCLWLNEQLTSNKII